MRNKQCYALLNNVISTLIIKNNPTKPLLLYENSQLLVPPSKMSGSNSNITAEAVLMLRTRLDRAEKRIKLLTKEVNSIRTELSSLEATPNTNIREFSTSATSSLSEIDGKNGSSNYNPESKRPRCDNFIKENDYVVVYTDGACENNGYPNAKAGIGVWFGPNHHLNVSEPLTGLPTNNRAELHACIQAITIAHKNGVKKLKIKTDSQLIISSMTSWIHNWKKNNWKTANKTDVKNKLDLVMLDDVCQLLDVKWEHVKGHDGIAGNEAADQLAVAGATKYKK